MPGLLAEPQQDEVRRVHANPLSTRTGWNSEHQQILREYVHRFRSVISRADQLDRLEVYIAGLLDGDEPKNVEAIAMRHGASGPRTGFAQALQHFVSSSPWDANQFLQPTREHLLQGLDASRSIWVVQDQVFPKKGRHSVGVQRQFARRMGQKMNCQIGVAISQVTFSEVCTLSMRLYLPAAWLRDNPKAAERIPESDREPKSKAEIALQLIDLLQREGHRVPFIAAEEGYHTNEQFTQSLAERGLRLLPVSTDGVSAFDPSDSECSGLFTRLRAEPGLELPEDLKSFAASVSHWSIEAAANQLEGLTQRLGLDQFEGRTWLGWHHHVSLVIAAQGFEAWRLQNGR
jgi:SRSO17 transposase